MLKNKSLTVVLTAAFVLGIGGMATAASIVVINNGTGSARAANPTSSWRCYWCGKVLNRGSQYVQDSKGVWRSREPNTKNEKCPHRHEQAGGRHGWVWVSGSPPVDNYTTYFYCRRCGTLSGRQQKSNVPTYHKGCPANNGGSHDWAPTGIIRTR